MTQQSDNRIKQTITVVYTNYRDETSLRHIIPKRLWFGATKWHSEEQWLLDALDLEKGADRTFAMKDIRCWFQEG